MNAIKLLILAVLCVLVPQGCTLAMRGHGKKNGRNAPKRVPPRGAHYAGGGAVRRPLDQDVNVPSLDAFVANFTPEEFELNFGHKRGVNPPIQGLREVITPGVPVAGHQEQARAAERARASAELFARVQNAGNSERTRLASIDFKDLLDRGADINSYHNGLTPLLEAVRQGHSRVCESLIAQGADVNLPMNGDYSIDLVQQGEWFHQSSIWRLTLRNHDKIAGNVPSLTPLHIAAGFGDQAIVRLLIDAGANCNAMTPDGWTPLLLTSVLLREPGNRQALIDVIKLLVQGGADVNTCALMTKNPLDDGYLPNPNPITGLWLTPLLNALATNDVEMRTYLLEQGAHVNIHNNMARAEGRIIPLIDAAERDAAERYDVPLCQVLLEHGADARFQNSDGVSIWQIAYYTWQAHLCEVLIKEAQFLPSEEEVVASFNRVKATLLFFNRNKCCFPRDIQRMVLLKPGLKNDIMTVMFDRVQRGKAIPEFFAQLILSWLQEYKIEQLKNGMRPVYEHLMAQDNHSGNDARFIGLLDPDTLVSNFGGVITESVVKRFGPKEQAQPAQDPQHKE